MKFSIFVPLLVATGIPILAMSENKEWLETLPDDVRAFRNHFLSGDETNGDKSLGKVWYRLANDLPMGETDDWLKPDSGKDEQAAAHRLRSHIASRYLTKEGCFEFEDSIDYRGHMRSVFELIRYLYLNEAAFEADMLLQFYLSASDALDEFTKE